MDSSQLFHWLVQYHCERNLPRCLRPSYPQEGNPSFKEGKMLSEEGAPLAEGWDENKRYKGCLIISDGESLAERLKSDKIILDRHEPTFQSAATYQELREHLDLYGKLDGACVYDGHAQRLARIARFSNDSPALKKARTDALCKIPADFIFQGKETAWTWEEYDTFIGTKTDLAIVIPQAHSRPNSSVHAYQIKATAYGSLGMGKVTHFERQGLVEEFFLTSAPLSTGPFVNEEYKIVGVHRKYEHKEGKTVRVSEELWTPEQRKENRDLLPALLIDSQPS